MKKIKIFALLLVLLIIACKSQNDSQPVEWKAQWISPPETNLTDYGVYLFRNSFKLSEVPSDFIIHISADSRYRLFINGNAVCFGPARGDLNHWNFETINISKFLSRGENVISAQVFNWGKEKPVAQVTSRTAFIFQAAEKFQHLLNTGMAPWKVSCDSAFSQIKLEWWKWAHGWYAVGGSDNFACSKHPWGWELPGFDDSRWPLARILSISDGIAWKLNPRNIPMLEESIQRIPAICQSEGIDPNPSFLAGKGSITIPSHKTVSLILDNQQLTIGFPELNVSKGNKSTIKITYAESPFTPKNVKPNRNEIHGNQILGCYDIVQPDGGINRFYRPLWFRAFRYIKMEIETADEPLVINDYYNKFTAYPFERKASFNSNDSSLKKIWNVSWRTARCDAFETYMDCPYYEQLNYEGDSRIQSLISLYLTGDDRLMRNSILHFSHSMLPSGILQAAFPFMNKEPIIIPTYSLHFINMLHDYYMYRPDTAFLRQFLPDVESILNWYDKKTDASGLLGALPYWNYVDWGYNGIDDKIGKKGQSGIISLICAGAMDEASEIYSGLGETRKSADWKQKSEKLKLAVNTLCFDSTRNMYSDVPDKNIFSEQMNCMAIITNAMQANKQKALMERIAADTSLIKCSAYFKFYYFLALKKAGLGDQFVADLSLWKKMLDAGLTTFSETGNTSSDRSDCHAWSAHPAMEMLSIIAGITPSSPGFLKLRIQPSPNNLSWFKATMPHPKGIIAVEMRKEGNGYRCTITIPDKLVGDLVWKNKTIELKQGQQVIALK